MVRIGRKLFVTQEKRSFKTGFTFQEIFKKASDNLYVVIFDICKPNIKEQDETVSALVLQMVNPFDIHPERLAFASDIINPRVRTHY